MQKDEMSLRGLITRWKEERAEGQELAVIEKRATCDGWAWGATDGRIFLFGYRQICCGRWFRLFEAHHVVYHLWDTEKAHAVHDVITAEGLELLWPGSADQDDLVGVWL